MAARGRAGIRRRRAPRRVRVEPGRPVTFTEPAALWLLAIVAIAIVMPILSATRRARLEQRLATPSRQSFVITRRPGIRRAVVAIGVAVFLVLVVLASARPARSVEVEHGVST